MQRAQIDKQAAPPGVFATIAAAFSALLVVPWPALLPVALDAWLAWGARLSPAAVADPLAAGLADAPGVDPVIAEAVAAWGDGGDLTAVAGWFLPSLLAGTDAAAFAALGSRSVVAVPPGAALLLVPLMLLLGVAGVMAFKTLLARAMAGRRLLVDGVGREIARATVRYLGALALGLGAALAVAVVAGVLVALAAAAGIDLLPLVTVLLSAAVMVAAVLVAFVAEAVVVAQAGPLEAVRLSARTVSANLLPTLGLLLVAWLALFSLPQLLAPLVGQPVGMALAIIAHAFVAAGLAGARLVFFSERVVSRES